MAALQIHRKGGTLTNRENPSKSTLRILRKLGIGAFSGFVVSFSLAFLMAALPFDVPRQFEIAYVGIGGAIAFSLLLGWLTITLRTLVPQDEAMRRKVRQYFWLYGPIGLLKAVLALTQSVEEEGAIERSII